MTDYRDALHHTRHPWNSKCMNDIYDSLNMDGLEQPVRIDVLSNRRPISKDISD